ncbi:50S ribosomal protein L21 [bacterium]|nr:50S ribosomal protein L21 [bacterium]
MYAIFQSGGHQYAAAENDVIRVEKLQLEPQAEVTFDQVLAVRDGEDFKVGAPYVTGAKVTGKVVAQGRGKKIIVFKYRPKKHYRKIRGHRQDYTEVRVTSITG